MVPSRPDGRLFVIRIPARPVEMALKGQGKEKDVRRHEQQQ